MTYDDGDTKVEFSPAPDGGTNVEVQKMYRNPVLVTLPEGAVKALMASRMKAFMAAMTEPKR